MKKKFIALIVALALLCSLALPTSAITTNLILSDESVTLKEEKTVSNATLEDDFADDRIIVVLSNAASISLRSYTTADFSEFGCAEVINLTKYTTELANAKLRGDNSVTQRAAAVGKEQNLIVPQGFYDVDTNKFCQVLCLTLEESGKQNVLDTIASIIKHPDIIYAGPDYVIHTCSTTTNDPYRSNQWAIDKISLPQAWDITTGSATVRVGIIDSGIDSSHPDLSGRVNASLSRDFTTGQITPVNVVTDPYGHGTRVAGIIGAATNNQIGISGTCFNVTLVSLRVLDSDGSGYSSWAYTAIDYARMIGIPILNMSLGWTPNTIYLYDEGLEPIISEFPGLVICAAGNESEDLDSYSVYPACLNLNNIITVGASTSTDTICGFSNHSATSVDLFAPGEGILSCYPVSKCHDGTHDLWSTTHYSNGYHYSPGTSMATPYVTGVAALILAKYPNLTSTQIKARILDGVDFVGRLGSYCSTSGRLNAYKAVHNHNFSYSQIIATGHHRCCACGIDVIEPHTWTVVSNSNYQCTECGYVSNNPMGSVPDEFLQR